MRQKFCALCNKDWKTMYRVKFKEGSDWVFACKQCVLSVKRNNPHYRYGGTWKRWRFDLSQSCPSNLMGVDLLFREPPPYLYLTYRVCFLFFPSGRINANMKLWCFVISIPLLLLLTPRYEK